MKSQKIYWPWALGPRNYIWVNWTQKTYHVSNAFDLTYQTLAAIFTNRTSVSQESYNEINKIMKSQNIFWPWGLGTRNHIWTIWAQKTYRAICPEPEPQFSQAGPHFFENHQINPVKSWNLKTFLDLGIWSPETTLGPLGQVK